jgi:hypothetical protein
VAQATLADPGLPVDTAIGVTAIDASFAIRDHLLESTGTLDFDRHIDRYVTRARWQLATWAALGESASASMSP